MQPGSVKNKVFGGEIRYAEKNFTAVASLCGDTFRGMSSLLFTVVIHPTGCMAWACDRSGDYRFALLPASEKSRYEYCLAGLCCDPDNAFPVLYGFDDRKQGKRVGSAHQQFHFRALPLCAGVPGCEPDGGYPVFDPCGFHYVRLGADHLYCFV